MSEVIFRSTRFASKEPQAHFINERCFGEDLAKWLAGELNHGEFSTKEPFQEDWGWMFGVWHGKEKFAVTVGIMDESIGEDNPEWRVGIEQVRSWLSFRKPDPAPFEELKRRLADTLAKSDGITEVAWQE